MNQGVVITGAAGLLGRCLVDRYLSMGDGVVGLDNRPFLRGNGGGFMGIKCDVRNFYRVPGSESVFEGDGKPDIVINCAGIVLGTAGDILDINLRAAIAISNLALDAGATTIVNVCSLNALMADREYPVYSAAKAGLLHWTRVLASMRPSVNFQALCPGNIAGKTIVDIPTPADREVTPDQVVDAMLAGLERREVVVTVGW